MKKRAAIELSIGTIVIIVLAMSMLILGMVLVKNIFSGAMDITDLNKDQISAEIAKAYGDDDPVVLYPNIDVFEINDKEPSAFAIRIKNLLENTDASDVKFSYLTVLSDFRECGLNERQILEWLKGEEGNNIPIASNGEHIEKILIEIPTGTTLCSFKLRIDVSQNNVPYGSAQMFIKIGV
jgi:hypothetical protein